MSLYTIIAEWKAGTYSRQVTADKEALAVTRWLQQLETQPIKSLGAIAQRKAVEKQWERNASSSFEWVSK